MYFHFFQTPFNCSWFLATAQFGSEISIFHTRVFALLAGINHIRRLPHPRLHIAGQNLLCRNRPHLPGRG